MGLHRRSETTGGIHSSEPISKTSFILGNIQGLKIKKRTHKIKMIEELATEHNSLIIGLTESHLNKNIDDSEVAIEGFSSYRADRSENVNGGVIVYIKDEWQSQVRVLTTGSINLIEYLVLYLEKINLVLVTIYRSPGSDRPTFSLVMKKNRRFNFRSGAQMPLYNFERGL